MPKKLTQEQRQEKNAARREKVAAGTTTTHLTATTTTGFAYSRDFTLKPEVAGGTRRRGVSVGRRETTTNHYEDRTTYTDGRAMVVSNSRTVASTRDVDRLHSHEAVPDWHTPTGSRRPGDTDTNTHGDVSADSVRNSLGKVK